jgi:hypothetical protein
MASVEGAMIMTHKNLVERVEALNKKRGLSPAEYALTLGFGLYAGTTALRRKLQRQIEVDPEWTEVEVESEDVERFADFAEKLIEVLQVLCSANEESAP